MKIFSFLNFSLNFHPEKKTTIQVFARFCAAVTEPTVVAVAIAKPVGLVRNVINLTANWME